MASADTERLKALLGIVRTGSPAVAALLAKIAGESALQALVSAKDVQDPQAQDEHAESLQRKWRTRRGQLWQIGPHRLLCGDSRDDREVARLWSGAPAIRMTWTDPPYGVDYVTTKNRALKGLHRGTRIKTPIVNDDLSTIETHELFRDALKVAATHSAPGATCFATVPGGPSLKGFIQAFEDGGFSFKHQLVWVKSHFVIGRSDYHHRHEAILYGWLENGPHYFCPDRSRDSVFEVPKPAVSADHPTTKPTELIAQMIIDASRTKEVVYDPFCGSGSMFCAAHQLNRIGFGVESDPRYVAVTLERLSALGLSPAEVR